MYISVEKITPKELDEDTNFISQCQEYLEESGKPLAMFGKLGSGKRTLAAQVSIRLAKKYPTLKIKIVTERDTISKDLESMYSTILIIHDPIKPWYTDGYTAEITRILLRICRSAKNKDNHFYVIAIFHCNDQFGEMKRTVETIFPKTETICGNKISVKLTDMIKNNEEDISNFNVLFQKGEKIIGEFF